MPPLPLFEQAMNELSLAPSDAPSTGGGGEDSTATGPIAAPSRPTPTSATTTAGASQTSIPSCASTDASVSTTTEGGASCGGGGADGGNGVEGSQKGAALVGAAAAMSQPFKSKRPQPLMEDEDEAVAEESRAPAAPTPPPALREIIATPTKKREEAAAAQQQQRPTPPSKGGSGGRHHNRHRRRARQRLEQKKQQVSERTQPSPTPAAFPSSASTPPRQHSPRERTQPSPSRLVPPPPPLAASPRSGDDQELRRLGRKASEFRASVALANVPPSPQLFCAPSAEETTYLRTPPQWSRRIGGASSAEEHRRLEMDYFGSEIQQASISFESHHLLGMGANTGIFYNSGHSKADHRPETLEPLLPLPMARQASDRTGSREASASSLPTGDCDNDSPGDGCDLESSLRQIKDLQKMEREGDDALESAQSLDAHPLAAKAPRSPRSPPGERRRKRHPQRGGGGGNNGEPSSPPAMQRSASVSLLRPRRSGVSERSLFDESQVPSGLDSFDGTGAQLESSRPPISGGGGGAAMVSITSSPLPPLSSFAAASPSCGAGASASPPPPQDRRAGRSASGSGSKRRRARPAALGLHQRALSNESMCSLGSLGSINEDGGDGARALAVDFNRTPRDLDSSLHSPGSVHSSGSRRSRGSTGGHRHGSHHGGGRTSRRGRKGGMPRDLLDSTAAVAHPADVGNDSDSSLDSRDLNRAKILNRFFPDERDKSPPGPPASPPKSPRSPPPAAISGRTWHDASAHRRQSRFLYRRISAPEPSPPHSPCMSYSTTGLGGALSGASGGLPHPRSIACQPRGASVGCCEPGGGRSARDADGLLLDLRRADTEDLLLQRHDSMALGPDAHRGCPAPNLALVKGCCDNLGHLGSLRSAVSPGIASPVTSPALSRRSSYIGSGSLRATSPVSDIMSACSTLGETAQEGGCVGSRKFEEEELSPIPPQPEFTNSETMQRRNYHRAVDFRNLDDLNGSDDDDVAASPVSSSSRKRPSPAEKKKGAVWLEKAKKQHRVREDQRRRMLASLAAAARANRQLVGSSESEGEETDGYADSHGGAETDDTGTDVDGSSVMASRRASVNGSSVGNQSQQQQQRDPCRTPVPERRLDMGLERLLSKFGSDPGWGSEADNAQDQDPASSSNSSELGAGGGSAVIREDSALSLSTGAGSGRRGRSSKKKRRDEEKIAERALARRARMMREQLRAAEMTELAREAERAANAGEERFVGEASTFGPLRPQRAVAHAVDGWERAGGSPVGSDAGSRRWDAAAWEWMFDDPNPPWGGGDESDTGSSSQNPYVSGFPALASPVVGTEFFHNALSPVHEKMQRLRSTVGLSSSPPLELSDGPIPPQPPASPTEDDVNEPPPLRTAVSFAPASPSLERSTTQQTAPTDLSTPLAFRRSHTIAGGALGTPKSRSMSMGVANRTIHLAHSFAPNGIIVGVGSGGGITTTSSSVGVDGNHADPSLFSSLAYRMADRALNRPDRQRERRIPKVRVMQLRPVEDVIPPFGQMHMRMRTHLADRGVSHRVLGAPPEECDSSLGTGSKGGTRTASSIGESASSLQKTLAKSLRNLLQQAAKATGAGRSPSSFGGEGEEGAGENSNLEKLLDGDRKSRASGESWSSREVREAAARKWREKRNASRGGGFGQQGIDEEEESPPSRRRRDSTSPPRLLPPPPSPCPSGENENNDDPNYLEALADSGTVATVTDNSHHSAEANSIMAGGANGTPLVAPSTPALMNRQAFVDCAPDIDVSFSGVVGPALAGAFKSSGLGSATAAGQKKPLGGGKQDVIGGAGAIAVPKNHQHDDDETNSIVSSSSSSSTQDSSSSNRDLFLSALVSEIHAPENAAAAASLRMYPNGDDPTGTGRYAYGYYGSDMSLPPVNSIDLPDWASQWAASTDSNDERHPYRGGVPFMGELLAGEVTPSALRRPVLPLLPAQTGAAPTFGDYHRPPGPSSAPALLPTMRTPVMSSRRQPGLERRIEKEPPRSPGRPPSTPTDGTIDMPELKITSSGRSLEDFPGLPFGSGADGEGAGDGVVAEGKTRTQSPLPPPRFNSISASSSEEGVSKALQFFAPADRTGNANVVDRRAPSQMNGGQESKERARNADAGSPPEGPLVVIDALRLMEECRARDAARGGGVAFSEVRGRCKKHDDERINVLLPNLQGDCGIYTTDPVFAAKQINASRSPSDEHGFVTKTGSSEGSHEDLNKDGYSESVRAPAAYLVGACSAPQSQASSGEHRHTTCALLTKIPDVAVSGPDDEDSLAISSSPVSFLFEPLSDSRPSSRAENTTTRTSTPASEMDDAFAQIVAEWDVEDDGDGSSLKRSLNYPQSKRPILEATAQTETANAGS